MSKTSRGDLLRKGRVRAVVKIPRAFGTEDGEATSVWETQEVRKAFQGGDGVERQMGFVAWSSGGRPILE